MQVFTFVMVVWGVTGLYFAGNRRVIGWWIGLTAQVMWVVFAAVTDLWPFYISAAAYGWVNARNLLKWHRERTDG